MILSDLLSPFLVRNSIRFSWLKSQQSFCLDCRPLLSSPGGIWNGFNLLYLAPSLYKCPKAVISFFCGKDLPPSLGYSRRSPDVLECFLIHLGISTCHYFLLKVDPGGVGEKDTCSLVSSSFFSPSFISNTPWLEEQISPISMDRNLSYIIYPSCIQSS